MTTKSLIEAGIPTYISQTQRAQELESALPILIGMTWEEFENAMDAAGVNPMVSLLIRQEFSSFLVLPSWFLFMASNELSQGFRNLSPELVKDIDEAGAKVFRFLLKEAQDFRTE